MSGSVNLCEADCLLLSGDNVSFIFVRHYSFLRSLEERFAFRLLSNNSNTVAKIDLILIIIKWRAELINIFTFSYSYAYKYKLNSWKNLLQYKIVLF